MASNPFASLYDHIPQPEREGVFSTLQAVLDDIELYLSDTTQLHSKSILSAIMRRISTFIDTVTNNDLKLLAPPLEPLHQLLHTAKQSEATSAHVADACMLTIDFLKKILSAIASHSENIKSIPDALTDFLFKSSQCLATALEQLGNSDEGNDAPLVPMRIVIVDDEDVVREFMYDFISEMGHSVLVLDNGLDAMTALDTGIFDLMFTDINMPRADGLQVLKHAHDHEIDTEVVIITGFATIENATQALRLGAYDYLTKPFSSTANIVSILGRVSKHIQLRRSNHRLMLELHRKNQDLATYARRLEEALDSISEKNQALIHSDRMATIGILAAGVAHEINNPTTFIRSNMQIFEKFWKVIMPVLSEHMENLSLKQQNQISFISEEMPVLMRDIISGTDRIATITNGLRSFARQDENDSPHRPVALETCIHDALTLIQPRTPDSIEVIQEYEPDLPTVDGDMQQMTQVFVNLFVNALDAMSHCEEGKLRICATSHGDSITVSICDSGHGIPENIRNRIFDPFFTTKSVGSGTGLGLSIILGIVRDHGGVINYRQPESEKGAIFDVIFPKSGTRNHQTKTIPTLLIADDDATQTQILSSGLKGLGDFRIETAQSGTEVLQKARSIGPDLLVLDVLMPDLDGFEIISQLKEDPTTSNIPVLALTGFSTSSAKDRLLALGVEEVLYKPCKASKLLISIKKYCPSAREHP